MRKQRRSRPRPTRPRSSVIVVELDPALRDEPRATRLNPDGDPDLPVVRVSTLASRHPDEAYPDDDFSGSKSRDFRKHGVRVLPDFTMRVATRRALLRRQERLVDLLREQGYWVLNGAPRVGWSVYVVELDPRVREEPGVIRHNPGADFDKPCVYVGQTGKTPAQRLADHQAGRNASKHVRDWGLRLMPRLYERFNPLTELESLDMEAALAKNLRKKGYTVLGGH